MNAVAIVFGLALAAVGFMFIGRKRSVRLLAGHRYRATSNIEKFSAPEKALALAGLIEFGATMVPTLDSERVLTYDVTATRDRDLTPGVSAFTLANPLNPGETLQLVVDTVAEVL